MSELQDLLEQKQELEKQIEEIRARKIAEAVQQVQSIVNEFDLSPKDIFPGIRLSSQSARKPVPPKYRDPVSGKTWTGRGKPPRWIADQDRDQFLIR